MKNKRFVPTPYNQPNANLNRFLYLFFSFCVMIACAFACVRMVIRSVWSTTPRGDIVCSVAVVACTWYCFQLSNRPSHALSCALSCWHFLLSLLASCGAVLFFVFVFGQVLTSCRHEHLVPLLGICLDPTPMLVYPFVGQSLEWHMREPQRRARIGWRTRLSVALSVSKGLQVSVTLLSELLSQITPLYCLACVSWMLCFVRYRRYTMFFYACSSVG